MPGAWKGNELECSVRSTSVEAKKQRGPGWPLVSGMPSTWTHLNLLKPAWKEDSPNQNGVFVCFCEVWIVLGCRTQKTIQECKGVDSNPIHSPNPRNISSLGKTRSQGEKRQTRVIGCCAPRPESSGTGPGSPRPLQGSMHLRD